MLFTLDWFWSCRRYRHDDAMEYSYQDIICQNRSSFVRGRGYVGWRRGMGLLDVVYSTEIQKRLIKGVFAFWPLGESK